MPGRVVLQALACGLVDDLEVQRVALTAVGALHVRVSDVQGTPLDRDVRDGIVVETDAGEIVLRRDHVLPTIRQNAYGERLDAVGVPAVLRRMGEQRN
jgi:hypothetical protein